MQRDVEASRALHDQGIRDEAGDHPEPTPRGADRIKAVVFGGLDGICTSMALLAGGTGAAVTVPSLVLIGVAQAAAGSAAMTLGDYLAESASRKAVLSEMEREAWEIENYPEGERREMVRVYRAWGLSEEEAGTVATILSGHPEFWMRHMVMHELGLIPVEQEDALGALDMPAIMDAVTLGTAFFVCGCLPPLACAVPCYAELASCASQVTAWTVAPGLVAGAAELALLGALRARAEGTPPALGVCTMLLQGGLTAAVALLAVYLCPPGAS